jgi:hypothetical protein
MECYEGATMIKTYKGMLEDGGQDKIRLKTNKGDIGYRITKFEIMAKDVGTVSSESVVKIYKLLQSSVTGVVDFTDADILGAAFVTSADQSYAYPPGHSIIFDREIFNQDIYVTHKDMNTGEACNYYLELEQIKLNDNESTMATLQSLRRFALPRN